MRNEIKTTALLLVSLSLLTGFVGVAAADSWADDERPTVSFGTYDGQIQSNDDRDTFQLSVSAGQVVNLSLSKDAGDQVTATLRYPGQGSFSDPVYLSNSGGTSDFDQRTIEEDGFVRVTVEGYSESGDTLPWTLSVTDSGIRDDWIDSETNQVSFGSHRGQINSDDDSDTFDVPVAAGQVVNLTLSKDAGDQVTAAVRYPGQGSFDDPVYLSNSGGTSDFDQRTIEEDGFVRVTVAGSSETNDDLPWLLSVTDSGVRDDWIDSEAQQVSFGTHSGQINSDDDDDSFEIPVSAGQVVDLELTKEAGDRVTAELRYPGQGSFDDPVYLSNNGGTSDFDQRTIEEDGFVRVTVEGYAQSNVDLPWTLSVTDSGVRDEWLDSEANQVSFGTHAGRINSDDDTESFEIPVSQGDSINTTLSKDAGDRVTAELRYPGQGSFDDPVYLSNNGGTSDSDQRTIEADGFVRITVSGLPEEGDLPWSVAVATGSQSASTDTSTSEPETQTPDPVETPMSEPETPTPDTTQTPTPDTTQTPTPEPIETSRPVPVETVTPVQTETPALTDPSASLDDEMLPLVADAPQRVAGETTVDAGTELTVRLEATRSGSFVRESSAQVDSDGSFATMINLDDTDAGTSYDLRLLVDDRVLLERSLVLATCGTDCSERVTETPTPMPVEPTDTPEPMGPTEPTERVTTDDPDRQTTEPRQTTVRDPVTTGGSGPGFTGPVTVLAILGSVFTLRRRRR